MKYFADLLFAITVVGLLSTNCVAAQYALGEFPGCPVPAGTIGLGTLFQDYIGQVIDNVVQWALQIVDLFIPGTTPVPLSNILKKFVAAPIPNLSTLAIITFEALDITDLQPYTILTLLPVSVKNTLFNVSDLLQFLAPKLKALPSGAPIPFSVESKLIGQYLTQTVSHDLVNLIDCVQSL